MSSSRIFVSYVCIGDEQGGRIGKQLVNDIRATGIEAVSDHETISDERFMPFLMRELPQCGCLVVVQTLVALQSWRVQSTLALASTLIAQQQLRAMRVIAAPSENADEQPLWTSLVSFDASIDYARAREKLFLVLGLTHLNADDSFIVPLPPSLLGPGLSGPASGPLSLQPPGLMPGPVRPTQPSQPMPRSAGSDRPGQIPGPVPQAVGTNWPPQPPAPLAPSDRTNWPLQPPAPQSRSVAPGAFPGASVSQPGDRPGFLLKFKHIWLKAQAFVTGLWTRQTSIAAQPGGFLRTIEAPPLHEHYQQRQSATRWFVIRQAIVAGILLALILAIILIVVLVRSHMPHQR